MKHKYLPKTKGVGILYNGPGRPSRPEEWIVGPDNDLRNKYYAYLKHRAQCKFRKEDYSLTWDDWCELWTDELWEQRGRGRNDMILTRAVFSEGWHMGNCTIQDRKTHLARRSEYKDV